MLCPKTRFCKILRQKYGPLFDIPKLQSQLQFVYQDQDFLKETPSELLHYIFSVNMQDCVPEFVKLLKLNAVMAVSSASAERSFSCLGRVKSYLRNSMGDQRLSSLCRISIHKDILKENRTKKSCIPVSLKSLFKSQEDSILSISKS